MLHGSNAVLLFTEQLVSSCLCHFGCLHLSPISRNTKRIACLTAHIRHRTITMKPDSPSLKIDIPSDGNESSTVSIKPVNPSPKSPSDSSVLPTIRKEFYRRPLPDICLSFSSPEGKVVFAEALAAGHMDSYFPLASQFRTQDEPAFCGLTSLVMALNSLEVDPHRVWKGPWRYYHENMLDCCVPIATVEHSGITMDQFACLAACNTLHVHMFRADGSVSEEHFRNVVAIATSSIDQVVVSSYSRQAVKQTGDGHFSPIGGYHPGRDLVLIMDTARFKYPPHWIRLPVLFEAMQRIDKDSGLPRGYFVLSKSQLRPALLFHLSSSLSPMSLEQNTFNVVSFLHAWQMWLLTSISSAMSGLDLVRTAIHRLMDLVKTLEGDSFLLAAHVSMASDDENIVSGPPLSCPVNGILVQRLLAVLESSPVFGHVEHILTSFDTSVVDRVGRSVVALIEPGHGDELVKGDQSAICTSVGSLGELKATSSTQQRCIHLNGTHFVVMLLLSWPYHRCSRNTFGLALQKYTTSQLKPGHPVCDIELLQNEVSRIRQQLSTLINYAGAVPCSGSKK